MPLNSFEMDTVREVNARLKNRQPVAHWEKQMILNLLRREGVALTPLAMANAIKEGLNVEGIKVL